MGSGTEPIRVLHVDDDESFAELVETFLEREDERIEVHTATSAEAGLDRLERTTVDCIVSDYDMPGKNGIEFLERVRETHGDCPFVLFTGKGSEAVASEAISAGVTDYVQKSAGSEQYEILVNRIVNAVESARVRERAARQEQINTLIREINRRLVAAETVDAIESAVCRTLADSISYRFAWIGEPDPDTGEIVPRTSAGDADAYLEEVTLYHDDRPRGRGPGGRAIRTGELQVAQRISTDPTLAPWHDAAERYGYESVVVVPLSWGERRGMLAIYADSPHAFDETELSVLEELGGTVGRALQAAEVRQRLERRRETARTRKEHYYRTLAEALPNGAVALFDTDLRYTVVGGERFDALDISPEEMEGEPLTAVHSASFRERHLPHYRAALDGEQRRFEFEFEDRRFEGHVAPVRDDERTVVGGLALTQDVTERTTTQRQLERRERILREMCEVIAEPELSIPDRIRRLLEIGADALGVRYGILSKVDEDDRYVFEIVHSADGRGIGDGTLTEGDAVPLSVTNCERVIDTGETVVVGDVSENDVFAGRPPYADYELACYLGTPVVVDEAAYGTICFYDERPRAEGFSEWEVTLVDLLSRWVGGALHRRETNARLRAQSQRFREFTEVVSHDLRNPIGVLSGALELAAETGEPEAFDRCRRALERLESLTDDLTTLTRKGAVVEDVESVALGAAARACWETVETGTAELRVDDDATIRADRKRLRQLLENLFRNSVEHGATDDGTAADDAPALSVRVGVVDDGFYVADDGVGIPADRREEVLERGYSTAGDGSGLGLAIVEKMATAHGWTVAVTESDDGGARIEVRGVDARVGGNASDD